MKRPFNESDVLNVTGNVILTKITFSTSSSRYRLGYYHTDLVKIRQCEKGVRSKRQTIEILLQVTRLT